MNNSSEEYKTKELTVIALCGKTFNPSASIIVDPESGAFLFDDCVGESEIYFCLDLLKKPASIINLLKVIECADRDIYMISGCDFIPRTWNTLYLWSAKKDQQVLKHIPKRVIKQIIFF
jgi:hypothetical protein